MNLDREKPSGYYACLILILLPIVGILLLPLLSSGLAQLPYALLMIAFVVIPLLGCGLDFRGRPLFQSPYHGEPFVNEVMNIHEDEQIA
ncbi:MAG: hypothetical protein E4H14_15180 [Candidatus Thorarchaeota archaeon]|nr:MAG: hypothetical protein E4H14_15180 [Candidatus Thorarchaeota archaeon]